MAGPIPWSLICRSLSEGKIHEVPLNFSLDVEEERFAAGDSFSGLVRKAIYYLQRHDWEIYEDRDYSRRRIQFSFVHQNPQNHAASALRAAGHSTDPGMTGRYPRGYSMNPYDPAQNRPTTASEVRITSRVRQLEAEDELLRLRTTHLTEAMTRQIMAAAGLTAADIDPTHANPHSQTPSPPAVAEPAPTPPPANPPPIHVRCGVRKIHRATP